MIKQFFNVKNILFILVFSLINAVITFFLKYAVMAGDDVSLGFFDNLSLEEIIHCDHGRYLSGLQQKMFSVLADTFFIHPNTLIGSLGAFIKGFDIALFCLIFALFPYITRKSTNFTPFVMILMFIFYMKQLLMYNIDELRHIDFHFGYCFGSLLYFAFLLILGHVFIKKIQLSQKQLCCVCILSFLSSLNDTFALTGIFFIFILNLYLFFNINEKKNIKNMIISYFKNNRSIFFISLSFIIGAVLALKGMMNDSHVTDFIDSENKTSFISYWFNMLLLFIPEFFKEIIVRHFPALASFAALLFICIKSNNDNKKQIIIYSTTIILSMWLFFTTLIAGGTETFYEKGKFWISHCDLQLFYNMGLICVILILWGFISQTLSNKKHLYSFYSVSAILIIISLLGLPNVISKYRVLYQNIKQERVAMYQAEKMYLFYIYKKEQPVLPISVFGMSGIGSAWRLGLPKTLYEPIDLYEVNHNNPEWKDYEQIVTYIKETDFKDAELINKYIRKIYRFNEKKLIPYKFDLDETAYEKFYNAGGKFSDDEKDYRKINFNKLLDKKYVLNN